MIDLAEIGFTKEELQEKIIDRLVGQLMTSCSVDDEDNAHYRESKFALDLEKKIKETADATINAMAEKFILPNVKNYIENLTLQQTNQWGEKKGSPVTFVEYLTQRAESYMNEKVNWEGKTKEESGSYNSFNGAQTRIAHMINKHLHFSIETAMSESLKIATSAISTGIQETVKMKLGEIQAALKTSVSVK